MNNDPRTLLDAYAQVFNIMSTRAAVHQRDRSAMSRRKLFAHAQELYGELDQMSLVALEAYNTYQEHFGGKEKTEEKPATHGEGS